MKTRSTEIFKNQREILISQVDRLYALGSWSNLMGSLQKLGTVLLFMMFCIVLQAQDEEKTLPFTTSDEFGTKVDVYQDQAVVLAPYERDTVADTYGAMYIYEFSSSNQSWIRKQRIALDYRNASFSLLELDVAISENYIAVTGVDDQYLLKNVSIYQKLGLNWVYSEEISKSTQQEGATLFGSSLDLDGNTLIIGAPGDYRNGEVGIVYIYEFRLGSWREDLKYVSTSPGDKLGSSVAIHGNFALAGAPDHAQGGRVTVFEKLSGQWQFQKHIQNPANQPQDLFGAAVDIDHQQVAIGAPNANSQHTINTGAVYLYNIYSTTSPQGTLHSSRRLASYGYDVSVSSENASNVYLAVGAPNDGEEGNVYVYQNISSNWVEIAQIYQNTNFNQNLVGLSQLGRSVAISKCCNYHLLIGDPKFGYSTNNNLGAVFTFRIRSGVSSNKVIEIDELYPMSPVQGYLRHGSTIKAYRADGISNVFFEGSPGNRSVRYRSTNNSNVQRIKKPQSPGFGKAIVYDGEHLLIGAPDDGSGNVFVYEQDVVGFWVDKARLSQFQLQSGDQYGFSIAHIGDWIVIGAPGYNQNSGIIYIYEIGPLPLAPELDTYFLRQTISAPNSQPGAHFGYEMDMTDSTLVVSAPFWDGDPNQNWSIDRGAVYIYQLDASSQQWNYTQNISRTTLPGDFSYVQFGYDLDLQVNAQGKTQLLVGAPGDYVFGAYGAAYLLEQNNFGGFKLFSGLDTLVASDRDYRKPDEFGASVSLSEDGALIGAGIYGSNSINQRAAYYYQESNGQWTETAKLTPQDKFALRDYDYYASEVTLLDDIALIGDPGDDEIGPEVGAVYTYDLSIFNTGNRASVVQEINTPKDEIIHPMLSPKVYPNPSQGNFQLQIPESYGKIKQAYLIDKLGMRQQVSLEGMADDLQIHTLLKEGLYLLWVEFEGHSPVTFKVVIE